MAAQWSPAFCSYDSDVWTYVLIVERVADGQDVLGREPFRLEPPAGPHLSAVWLGLGLARPVVPLSALALVRGLALVSIGLLSFAAWTLADRLFGAAGPRAASVALFWLAMPETWSAVALGRFVSLAFMVLAAAAAVQLGRRPRAALAGAAFVALGFYTHLFGGVLALAAMAVVVMARRRCGEAVPWRDLRRAFALGVLFAIPCLGYALSTAGLARTSAHDWRPEQLDLFGLRWMNPVQLLKLVPAAILVLAVVGCFAPAPPERRLAREIVRVGGVAAALVLLTPLHHVAVALFGGWMIGRVATLALPWLGAILALEWLRGPGQAAILRAAGGALCAAAVFQGAARAASDWRDRDYEFTPAAQEEATGLRPILRGRTYLTADLLGYGTAAPTLGRPLAVPPGHASPFGDFRRQQRRVHVALAANQAECWRAFFALYPDAEFLLTPAASAVIERRIWSERFPGTSPEAIRERLRSLGVLETVREGSTYVLDALRPAGLAADVPTETAGAGLGSRCREE